jgi:xylulokinase
MGTVKTTTSTTAGQVLVGLDVGTSSVKAVAITLEGRVTGTASEQYQLRMPKPGWAEQDPEAWWRAARRALARLEGEPVAIGLTGQMHGLVCLDRGNRVLRPAILWNDQRTHAECGQIERLIGFERLIELTGNRALTGFTAPKLLWMRAHEPDLYGRIARICLPKDYVRLKLTGEQAIDVTDASGTLLFDVAARRWSEEILDALDVPPAWLPPALESQEVSGYTHAGVPVAAGAGDQAAGALGVGVVGAGPLSVVLGTSGVVFSALDSFVSDPWARLHVFCHAVPSTWHAMGVMLSAAGSLNWLRSILGGSYERMLAEAVEWGPGCDGLSFAPYLSGERTPHADPDVRGAFCGLDLGHDRGALCRAVLEGVAFGLRDSLELLRSLGLEPRSARVSGGGANSELWLKIIASVLRLPLERTVNPDGAAFGAALLGGISAGVFADASEAVSRCVSVSGTVEPDRAWADRYDDLYADFRALYPALRGLSQVPDRRDVPCTQEVSTTKEGVGDA